MFHRINFPGNPKCQLTKTEICRLWIGYINCLSISNVWMFKNIRWCVFTIVYAIKEYFTLTNCHTNMLSIFIHEHELNNNLINFVAEFEEITSLRLNKTEINLFLTNIHSRKLFQRIVIMEVYVLEYDMKRVQCNIKFSIHYNRCWSIHLAMTKLYTLFFDWLALNTKMALVVRAATYFYIFL